MTLFFSSAGSAVCVVQLRAGGGSCGQLLQLSELWRVRVVQRPLLCLDWVAVSGRQDGSTWQVRDRTRRSTNSVLLIGSCALVQIHGSKMSFVKVKFKPHFEAFYRLEEEFNAVFICPCHTHCCSKTSNLEKKTRWKKLVDYVVDRIFLGLYF